MKIAVFGSCRQESLSAFGAVTDLMEKVTYPHYTAEALQMLRFCLFNQISTVDTRWIFRAGLLSKAPINWTPSLAQQIIDCDIAFLEVASRKTYRHKDLFAHHIITEPAYNSSYSIQEGEQTFDEIMEDIIEIQALLQKPLVLIGHLVTRYNNGARHELLCWLREICLQLGIEFVDPVRELKAAGVSLDMAFSKEKCLSHYTPYGHAMISKVYKLAARRALRAWHL